MMKQTAQMPASVAGERDVAVQSGSHNIAATVSHLFTLLDVGHKRHDAVGSPHALPMSGFVNCYSLLMLARLSRPMSSG